MRTPRLPRRRPAPAPAVAVGLRDGTSILVRPIRPQDAPMLHAGFERLSPESRYRRFLSARSRLDEPLLRYLTHVDHHDHEALVAIGPGGGGLGVARFVRSRRNRESAEAAVTVADDWQRRGVGGALLALLADRARAVGVRRFTAVMLASNAQARELFAGLGATRIVDREDGIVEVEIELPAHGTGPALHELLRASASGQRRIAPWRMAGGADGRERAHP